MRPTSKKGVVEMFTLPGSLKVIIDMYDSNQVAQIHVGSKFLCLICVAFHGMPTGMHACIPRCAYTYACMHS